MEPTWGPRCIRDEMRNTIRFVTTLALILIAGVPALAKGPSSATITGPGIEEPIELFDQRQPEQEMHEQMVDLIEQTGLWYATPTLERIDRPAGLGEPLVLAWVNMGPPHLSEEERTIRQLIYLHAEGGPVIHTLEGHPSLGAWGGEITGWYRASTELVGTLQAFGVPTDAGGPAEFPSPMLALGALALLVLIATRLMNSRLRPVVSSQ